MENSGPFRPSENPFFSFSSSPSDSSPSLFLLKPKLNPFFFPLALMLTSGIVMDPSGIFIDPSGSLKDPSGILMELSGNLKDPSDSLMEPSGNLNVPSGSLNEPSGILIDPLGNFRDHSLSSSDASSPSLPPNFNPILGMENSGPFRPSENPFFSFS